MGARYDRCPVTSVISAIIAAILSLESLHLQVGISSWYRWHPGQAAAGPELRSALGPHWRGSRVLVCSAHTCISVRLTDWCQCYGTRLIDLDKSDFARLAAPSRGLLQVTVDRLP